MITYLIIEICLVLIISYFISQLNVLFECIENEEEIDDLSEEDNRHILVNGIACFICLILLLINSAFLYISF